MSCLGKREVDFELFQNGTLVEWRARKILKKRKRKTLLRWNFDFEQEISFSASGV